ALGHAAVEAARGEQQVAVVDAALADARDPVVVRLDAPLDAQVAVGALAAVDDERHPRLHVVALQHQLEAAVAARGPLLAELLRAPLGDAVDEELLEAGRALERRLERGGRDADEITARDGDDARGARRRLEQR